LPHTHTNTAEPTCTFLVAYGDVHGNHVACKLAASRRAHMGCQVEHLGVDGVDGDASHPHQHLVVLERRQRTVALQYQPVRSGHLEHLLRCRQLHADYQLGDDNDGTERRNGLIVNVVSKPEAEGDDEVRSRRKPARFAGPAGFSVGPAVAG
jgi:hypothetical protein